MHTVFIQSDQFLFAVKTLTWMLSVKTVQALLDEIPFVLFGNFLLSSA